MHLKRKVSLFAALCYTGNSPLSHTSCGLWNAGAIAHVIVRGSSPITEEPRPPYERIQRRGERVHRFSRTSSVCWFDQLEYHLYTS